MEMIAFGSFKTMIQGVASLSLAIIYVWQFVELRRAQSTHTQFAIDTFTMVLSGLLSAVMLAVTVFV